MSVVLLNLLERVVFVAVLPVGLARRWAAAGPAP